MTDTKPPKLTHLICLVGGKLDYVAAKSFVEGLDQQLKPLASVEFGSIQLTQLISNNRKLSELLLSYEAIRDSILISSLSHKTNFSIDDLHERVRSRIELISTQKQRSEKYIAKLAQKQNSKRGSQGTSAAKKVVVGQSTGEGYKPLPYYEASAAQNRYAYQDQDREKPQMIELQEPSDGIVVKEGHPEIKSTSILYNPEDKSSQIGESVFGRVYKGKVGGKTVAIKVPPDEVQKILKKDMEAFRTQIIQMSQIYHPNIVLFMGACTEPGKVALVYEFIGTNLVQLLRSTEGRNLSLYDRLCLAVDCALGCYWLHSIGVVLLNLKLSHLMVVKHHVKDVIATKVKYTVKVSDFGFNKTVSNVLAESFPLPWNDTFVWLPPEVMRKEEITRKIDSYSFGLILWSIYTFQSPYANYRDWDCFYQDIAVEHERPFIDNNCPPSLKWLIQSCWNEIPTKRPEFDEILFRLGEVLVDTTVVDVGGRDFWKKHYLLPTQQLIDTIPWKEFVMSLSAETQLAATTFLVLHPFLANGQTVTLHQFNNAVNWFGPFFDKKSSQFILNEIKELTQKPWFHGNIDMETCDARLSQGGVGSFLVRLSNSYPKYPYTLSIHILEDKRHLHSHKRIKRVINNDGSVQYICLMEDKKTILSFSSLPKLIDGVKDQFSLTHPCSVVPLAAGYASGYKEDLETG